MNKSITQDMAYRQSLMKYAEKYGVSRASRKYNKSRSYIYFWKQRWDGSATSLACQSRRPHSHPNQHTEAERKLIRDMRRRNPSLGMIELWHRLRQRGYTRCPESLFRVMRKMGLFPAEKPKNRMCPDRKQLRVYQSLLRHKRDCQPCLKRLLPNWAFGTSSFVRIPRAITTKSSAAIARIRNAFIPAIPSILWTISQSSLPSTIAVPTTCP